ncbi:MAG TPA: hypothetical protein VJR06_08495 [Nitrososphaerales archaeon]|nr:hypothetical protein [Nitrososphaerales archaeon]
MSVLFTVAVSMYLVDAALFGALAYVYGKTALSTRAKYPLGLFVFSLLLLLQSAGTAASYLIFGGYIGDDVVPSMVTMAAFELVGILALLRITF